MDSGLAEGIKPVSSDLPAEWHPTVTRGQGFLEITTSRTAWSHAESSEEATETAADRLSRCSSVWEAIEGALTRNPEKDFLGAKHTDASGEWSPYQWLTFGHALDSVVALSSCFSRWGIQKGENAAIVAANSPEWVCPHHQNRSVIAFNSLCCAQTASEPVCDEPSRHCWRSTVSLVWTGDADKPLSDSKDQTRGRRLQPA